MRDMGMTLLPNDVCSSLSQESPLDSVIGLTSSLLAGLFNEGQSANACVKSQRFPPSVSPETSRCSCLHLHRERRYVGNPPVTAPSFPVSEWCKLRVLGSSNFIARLVNITWSAVVNDQQVRE